MNTKRLAQLFRERAALDLEIAAALEDTTQPARPRRRSTAAPTVQPSPEALERTRRALRRRGIEA